MSAIRKPCLVGQIWSAKVISLASKDTSLLRNLLRMLLPKISLRIQSIQGKISVDLFCLCNSFTYAASKKWNDVRGWVMVMSQLAVLWQDLELEQRDNCWREKKQ